MIFKEEEIIWPKKRGLKNPELNKTAAAGRGDPVLIWAVCCLLLVLKQKNEFTEIFPCTWIRNKELLYQTYPSILKLFRWAQTGFLVLKATRYLLLAFLYRGENTCR